MASCKAKIPDNPLMIVKDHQGVCTKYAVSDAHALRVMVLPGILQCRAVQL